jgi:hypothetical protein
MQESTMCYSKNDKPSKHEPVSYTYKWSLNNNCPDSDKKRTTACKDPNCKNK